MIKGIKRRKKTIEHHIIIKPRLGRSPLGVLINCISCLIHNRRDSLQEDHDSQKDNNRSRKKSITFIDSLDGSSRLTYDLNDYEWFDFPNKKPTNTIKRRYPVFFKPKQKDDCPGICDDCRGGWFLPDCEYYNKGVCWYFSNSDGETWYKPRSEIAYPADSIRSRRITSQETSKMKFNGNIYDNFIQKKVQSDGKDIKIEEPIGAKIDNLIATSSLEVGVDYEGISEIILYGDVASPASYKQRAGRGAREGNLDDGLVVMTVIKNTPLSNFYFKHFKRLVDPRMTPIRLETRNPHIVRSQCFSSIFDYFALKSIRLYKIREPTDPGEVAKQIQKQHSHALRILDERHNLAEYLRNFLSLINYQDESTINDAIKEAKSILSKMREEIDLPSGKKALIDCISLAVKGDANLKNQLKDKAKGEFDSYTCNLDEINRVKSQLKDELEKFEMDGNDELSNPEVFCNVINDIRRRTN